MADSWEARMAARAQQRADVERQLTEVERRREQAEGYRRSAPEVERHVERLAEDFTADEAREYLTAPIACACIGGPIPDGPCWCRLRAAAAERVIASAGK